MPALSGNWPWRPASVPSPLRPQPYESPDARRAKFDERQAVIDYLGRHFAAADPEDADLIWLLIEDIQKGRHRDE
jgi:hypothetical protein